ncbi:MAG: hypothetical protein JO233_07470, partial [Candidatus Eremiobacteraeota bacterium]|nr:hypothetical protein [Candidatus Eremiobacteraeota bacterium]
EERVPNLAITCNGPGEFAGWARPLLVRLFERAPQLKVHLFFVPDDYATGHEPDVARALFPQLTVHDAKTYVRMALGKKIVGMPASFDLVQYLGGDLMHAARLAKRCSARALTYKFSRPRYRDLFIRAFAVDMANVEQLVRWRVHRDRIVLTGNLAIDGALLEAQSGGEQSAAADGILIMPGSHRAQVAQLYPFFLAVAMRIRSHRPHLPIAFGASPFTPLEEVRNAVRSGGDPRFYALAGDLVQRNGAAYLCDTENRLRFPIVYNALAAAKSARLALTIPGTKTIELAALGTPMISCATANAPEMIAINGPLTYLDRVPLVGVPLKRAAVMAAGKRFPFLAQPNIDVQSPLVPELRGTLMPGHVARIVLRYYDDATWLGESRARLQALYAEHVGAADRMAQGILECAHVSRTAS